MTEDTSRGARGALLWLLPYLLLCAGALSLLSWAVERLLAPGLPLAGHAAAVALATALVGATLLLLRRTGVTH